MSTNHTGNVQNEILKEEHDGNQNARRVVLASGATVFAVVNTGASNSNTTLNPSPNQIGSVTISHTVNTLETGLLSLASGTEIRSLATLLNMPALIAGTAQIGLVTVSNFTAPNNGNVTLNPGPNQIGSVTISHPINAIVTIAPRNDYLGLMTVTQANQSQITLFPSPNFIGLITVGNTPNANVSLGASAQYIGNVTAYPARSATTVFAQVISASGYSTVFVPPSGQRFFLQAYQVNSQGLSNGFIGSASIPIWHFDSLVTYGKAGMTFNEPGVPGETIDRSLTIRQFSLVTLAVNFHVRFEDS